MLELSFPEFPLLNTSRLTLRRITEKDMDPLFALRSDENVMRHIARPIAKTRDDVFALINLMNETINEKSGINWAITKKQDDLLIGTIGYYRIQHENFRGEIGYLLAPSEQGKGLMHEAIREVLRFGFQVIGFHSIEGVVSPENAASIRVLERHGFVREALFREDHFWNGQFLDSAVYSLLAKNFSA